MGDIDFGALGTQTLSSAASGIVNSLMGMASAGLNYRYNKKLMNLQNQYNIDAFNRQNARQDYLLENSPSITRDALRKAGYSAADPNGTGVSSPAVQGMDTPSPVGAFASLGSANPMVSYSELKNAELIESQKKLNEENAKKLASDTDKVKLEIDQAKQSFDLTLKNLQADLDKKVAEKNLSEENAKKVIEEVKQLGEVVKGLQIDNRYKDQMNFYQVLNLVHSVSNAAKNGRILEAQAKLADQGIILSGDAIGTLVGIIANGKSSKFWPEMANGIGMMLASMPAAIKMFFEAFMSNENPSSVGDFIKNNLKKLGFDGPDSVRVDGEPGAKAVDDNFFEGLDNDEYDKMTKFIRDHAKRDEYGQIDNDEYRHWYNVYMKKYGK